MILIYCYCWKLAILEMFCHLENVYYMKWKNMDNSSVWSLVQKFEDLFLLKYVK